ncbi:MAG: hypothetical protein ACKVS6_13795 [Planctomycetota bacterium]
MPSIREIETKTALTPTGGFLRGYTHSFSPAIGCMLGKTTCGVYCYAQFLQAHKIYGSGEWGESILLKTNAPAVLRAELERAARRPPDHKYHLSNIRVFSASSTEPLAGPVFNIYKQCLDVLAEFTPAAWVVQTRSPLITNLRAELERIKTCAVVSMTIETDDDALYQIGAAGSPLPTARMRAISQMQDWNVPIHVAVSPALPIRNISTFADWLAENADAVTVDTAVDGDGTGDGKRTALTTFPELMRTKGYDWRDGSQARELYQLLKNKIGERAGWSSEGFVRLANRSVFTPLTRRESF